MRKITLVLVAMALAVPLAALPAQAATTFTVNTTNDAPDANPGDGACSTAANECTLWAAIQEANALSGDDVIEFAPSVNGTITLGGTHLFIDSNVKIEGPDADVLSVSANNKSRVFRVQSGTVEISGLTITGGSADVNDSSPCSDGDFGGGIYNRGTLTVSNSTVSENMATCQGGGIYNLSGTLTVSDSTISDNETVENSGGGIANFGTLTVERSTISGNTSNTRNGGGIHSGTNSDLTTTKTTITNSTISGNTAGTYGGGVFNQVGLTEIEHSTITKNSAPSGQGSGVASQGLDEYVRTEVYSSIISGNTNTDNTGTDVDFVVFPQNDPPLHNPFVSEGYNLIGDGNAATGSGEVPGAFDKSGDQINVTDPGLEPLGLNGGPTKTHALQESSPALNAGTPSSAPECQPPLIDQRGVARPQEGSCDIGSFERDTTAPTVSMVVPQESATGVSPSRNVRAYFSEAMDATNITDATFRLREKGSTTSLEATVTYDGATKMALLNPETDLDRGATYKAVVTSRVEDISGNALDQDPSVEGNQRKVWFFTVRR